MNNKVPWIMWFLLVVNFVFCMMNTAIAAAGINLPLSALAAAFGAACTVLLAVAIAEIKRGE